MAEYEKKVRKKLKEHGCEFARHQNVEAKDKGRIMCTAALQEELNGQIAGLSNENVRLLIEVAKSMKPARPATGDGSTEASAHLEANNASRPKGLSRSILGFFPGEVEIGDGFFETPECFKEYV